MSLWAVLLTGLFAGGASCAAVQGGLLTGVLARRHPERVVGKSPKARRAKRAEPRRPTRDDAVPVAGFLAGKLVSHALFGALLGLVGDAVQPSFRVRAYMQIAVGLVMVLLALDLIGVKGIRALFPRPPAAWTNRLFRGGRWDGGVGPALLGFVTILIPCGVTLTMMFLAIASASPFAGAAIMASFVVGTMPIFAAIGFATKRYANVLRGGLARAAGVVVLLTALLAINSGLVLNGSPLTLARIGGAATANSPPAAAPPLDSDGVQRIVVLARDTSYSPSVVAARPGTPTELTIRTNNTRGCTRSFVLPSFGVQRLLPATGDTTIELGELDPGVYEYTCGMGMYSGSIEVAT